MDNEDEYWMQRALTLAESGGRGGEVPVGAIVVLDGREIGAGYNAPISQCDPTAHAEIRALRDAARRLGNYRLAGATLYVTLEPCTMCAGALVHSRISRLVFGALEPKAGAIVSSNRILEDSAMNWRVAVTGGVLSSSCGHLLSEFFSRRRDQIRHQRRSASGTDRG
ncbi:tRNA adenosine(34) deaminase TadA [Marinobacter sp.]|uniref:tRNA adenosine(34) deaminase TadA n=1 Tax=Marinobacter sp. TaxID=50741 RepID=UPI00384D0378